MTTDLFFSYTSDSEFTPLEQRGNRGDWNHLRTPLTRTTLTVETTIIRTFGRVEQWMVQENVRNTITQIRKKKHDGFTNSKGVVRCGLILRSHNGFLDRRKVSCGFDTLRHQKKGIWVVGSRFHIQNRSMVFRQRVLDHVQKKSFSG